MPPFTRNSVLVTLSFLTIFFAYSHGASWKQFSFSPGDILPINSTYDPAITVDAASGDLWLFGGSSERFSLFDDTSCADLWKLDAATNKWVKLGPPESDSTPWPSSRTGGSLALAGGRLFLFGGIGELKSKGDDIPESYQLWVYHIAQARWDRIDCPDHFSCPTSMVVSFIFMKSLFWTPSSNELWHFDPATYEWVSHGRIPTPSRNPATAVLFPDYQRGKIIALMSESLTDRTINPFFIEYDLETGLWDALNVSGRFHQASGPTLIEGAQTLTSASPGALSFLVATESGSLWPDPKAFTPSNFHVFDAASHTWANLPRFAPAFNTRAQYVYASSGDGKAIYAIGGQGQDSAFEMWKYDVSCPDCSGHGTCKSGAYCVCDSSRFGGPDCSADCGAAAAGGCGNGYCLASYSSGQAECQCTEGFIGNKCDTPFECYGDGTLFNVNNTATCVCKQASGPRCEIPYYVPCQFGMSNNGSCKCGDASFGATCEFQDVVTETPVLNCTESVKSSPASWSWCFKRNVLLAPVRVPVTNTSDDDPLMKEPTCMDNSTYPNSTCKAIWSLDLLGAVRPSNANSRGMEIESLILVGLGSGEFGAVSFTGESIVGHWSLDSSPILFLRSTLLVESSLSRNPLALLCAADKNGFGLYVVGQNGTESVLKSSWLRPGDKIVSLQIMAEEVPRGNFKFNGFHITVWALFSRPESNEWFLQARVIGLDTTKVNNSRFDAFGAHAPGFTWKIRGSGVEGDLKMLRADHNGQLEEGKSGAASWNPSCNLGREFRPLLVIHSETTVGVFPMPPVKLLKTYQINASAAVADLIFSSRRGENRGALIVSLIDKTTSPSSAITGVSLFSDCWPTISAQSNGMWLMASVMDGSRSLSENRVEIVKLSEFQLHSRGCTEPLLPGLLDSTFPVTYASAALCDPSIVPSPPALCDISRFWWNSTACEERHRQALSLPFSPIQLERRFIGEPRGLVETSSLRTFKASNNQTLSVELESFLYNSVFIRDSSHRVHVWGMQEDLRQVNRLYNNTIPTLPMRVVELSSFYSAAHIEAMAVSENGEHAFVATSQQKWQIDSQRRLVEICETRLQNDTAKALLQAYEPLCEPSAGGLKPAKPSIAHFVFFMSMCTSGIYCPSFVSQVSPSETPILAAQQPEGGTYALFPGKLRNCSKGNFCSDGKQTQCPIGFKCPYDRMSLPIRCEPNPYLNTTCFSQGLANEMTCPSGFVCTGMDVPPAPAPPGYYLRNSTQREGPGTLCSPGDFCALGAGDPAPACPAGFYCSDPSDILPFMCPMQYDQRGIQVRNATSYCPAGSANASWCPVGFYCETPWKKAACTPGQWCPEGTQVPKECPAGRLCSTPGENIPCPAGFYCPPGTASAIRCSPLSLCSEGSSQERRWLALLIESIAIVVVGISYKLITIWNNRRWRINMEKRQQLRANVVNRYAALKEGEEDDSASDELPLLSGYETGGSQSSIAGSKVSPRPGLAIRFENLELKVGKKSAQKTVLESVSGQFLPGQLHAVMGPSGAGKTSLISVLSGQAAKTSGEILVNGLPQPNLERFKSVLGFVPQEDIMHRTLTVREILDFNAATRLDSRLTASDREDLVDDIIDILGLKKVEHSIVGDENRRGLSGGERKRVNVGMELAADPSILFLDEPTSGLDSTSAVQVIQCLKSIASRSNMTIICVIHQPRIEVFRLFDTVLFLQPGGRTVFQGLIPEAESYFEKHLAKRVPIGVNAADFYMDVISNASQQHVDLSETWARVQGQRNQPNLIGEEESVPSESSSLSSARSMVPFKSRNRAGFFYQLWLLFIRSLTLQLRDISSYLLNIFLIFIAGLLLGFIYSGSTFVGPASPEKQAACPEFVKEICAMPIKDEYVGEFTLLVLSLGLTGVASALNTFGSERITFWRESRAGINSLAFFIAKNLASIPMLLLPPLFLWSIFYFLTSPISSFWTVYGILIAVQFSCAAAGYVISLLVAPHSALLAGVVYVVICTLFSGSNPSLKKLNNYGLPAQILYNMSFSRWSVEALYCAVLTEYSATEDIQSALDFWGYNMHNFAAIDVICILSIGFVLLIAAFFILLFLHARRK